MLIGDEKSSEADYFTDIRMKLNLQILASKFTEIRKDIEKVVKLISLLRAKWQYESYIFFKIAEWSGMSR